MKTSYIQSVLGVFACGLGLLLSTPAFADAPAPERAQRRFEIGFLTQMIDHHFGAVKMAELCSGRTIHTELQTMCDEMKTAQLEEIATMQTWLQSWYGISHEPELDRRTQRQIRMLTPLTGAEFEKQFMLMMSMHHAMAITMGADCLLRAYHPEMINMCAMMVGNQGDEIAMMRLWLMQWYNINEVEGHARDRS